MAAKNRRRLLLVVAVAATVVLALGVVVAVEVVMAQRAPQLANTVGYPQGGRVEPDPAVPAVAGLVWADGAGPVAPPDVSREVGDRPVRITWLGDSTTTGVGASSAAEALPGQVARRLGRPVELEVLGRSGARIADVVNEQLPLVQARPPDQQPDVVVVSVGANDATHLTGNNAFRSAYLGLLDGLPRSSSVVVLGVPDLGSVPRFAQPLRALAGWRGGTLDWDVEQMRDHGADYVNIADFTGPAFGADPDHYFAADGFHPDDDGYRLWADTVVPVLRWRLYKRDHPTAPEPLQPKEAKGTVKGDAP